MGLGIEAHFWPRPARSKLPVSKMFSGDVPFFRYISIHIIRENGDNGFFILMFLVNKKSKEKFLIIKKAKCKIQAILLKEK